MRDAQTVPVDWIFLSSFSMLIFGDVDTIDTLGSIDQSLSFISVIFPFTYTKWLSWSDAESPALSDSILPFTFLISSVIRLPSAISVCLIKTVKRPFIVAERIRFQLIVDRTAKGCSMCLGKR